MPNLITSHSDLDRLAALLKALAEPRRLLILNLLIEGVQCNCELGDLLEMTPSLISHHMRILREAGLVEVEKDPLDARWIYYSVKMETLQQLNAVFTAFFQPQRIKPRHPRCGPPSHAAHFDYRPYTVDPLLPETRADIPTSEGQYVSSPTPLG